MLRRWQHELMPIYSLHRNGYNIEFLSNNCQRICHLQHECNKRLYHSVHILAQIKQYLLKYHCFVFWFQTIHAQISSFHFLAYNNTCSNIVVLFSSIKHFSKAYQAYYVMGCHMANLLCNIIKHEVIKSNQMSTLVSNMNSWFRPKHRKY